MSINRTSALFNSQNQNNNDSSEQKKSVFWVNVGYKTGVEREDGSEIIVTLPFGIPLDSMQYVQTNSRNTEWSELQQARNSLLDDLRKAASELAPGEEKELTLCVTLRRATEAVSETAGNSNKFARKGSLF
jgi:hypothetical protein